jgi:hypothetical protein
MKQYTRQRRYTSYYNLLVFIYLLDIIKYSEVNKIYGDFHV